MISFPALRRRVLAIAGREAVLLALFSLAAGLLLVFGTIAQEVREGETRSFDAEVFAWFGHKAGAGQLPGSERIQEFVRDVTALGSYAVLGYLTLACVTYLLLIRRYGHVVFTLVAVLGGTGLSTVLKAIFDRPRPDIPYVAKVFSASFPSGHAMLSTVTFLTLAALLTRVAPDRRARLFILANALFLSVVVGLSRIYLGVHYPTDVLAGWSMGGAWACACYIGARMVEGRTRLVR